MPMIDIYKKPIGYGEAQAEVDATPTPDASQAEGMQIKPTLDTHEKAWPGEYSPMFDPQRFVLAIGGVAIKTVPNIPRSWAVFANGDGAIGALFRVVSGSFDVTLAVGQSVIFPGRSRSVQVTCAVAAGDVTIVALGDDRLRF